MCLRLCAGAEAYAGDAVATLDGNTVGGEGPLVGQRTAFTLCSCSLIDPQALSAPQTVVSIDQSLNVSSVLLVDPSGEEALGLVNMAVPCGTVVHVHGNLHIVSILLASGQILDLLQAGLVGLAGGHAAVDGDSTAIGNSATGGRGVEDLRGGAGASAEETGILVVVGVVLRIQHLNKALDLLIVGCVVLVEVTDIEEDLSHLMDSVVTALGSGAVAGNTANVNTDLHSASVSTVDAAVGGLGGNDELDLLSCILGTVEVLVDDGLPAHAVAVFLLYGANDHDLVALGNETQLLHDLAAVNCGSHAAFLVGSAAAVDDLVGLIAFIGIMLPVVDVADADSVDVGVDSDDLLALAHPADDVAQSVDLDLVVAQLFHLSLDAHDNALFLTALAGDADHVTEEAAHIGTVALGSFLNEFKIHVYCLQNIILSVFFGARMTSHS